MRPDNPTAVEEIRHYSDIPGLSRTTMIQGK